MGVIISVLFLLGGLLAIFYAKPRNEAQAVEMQFQKTKSIADLKNSFEEMKKIRNAISHISVESKRAFNGLVRNKLGVLPPNVTTSNFLNTIVPNSTTTFFNYYKDVVINAITNISNP